MSWIGERSRALFDSVDANALVFRTSDSFPDSSVSYFTGIPKRFLSGNVLILKRGQKPVLLKSVLEPKISVLGTTVKRIDRKAQFEAVLKKELKGIRTVGINRPFTPASSMKALRKAVGKRKLVDVSKQLSSLRAVKSADEIPKIFRACGIAQKVSEKIPSVYRKGMTEEKLALEIEVLLRKKGENELPFPVIVASGKNAASPHHVPLRRKIRNGFLLIDFGACCGNYCSDITRMFYVGRPAEKDRRLYKKVFEAKQLAQSLARPGISCAAVFKETSSFLKKGTGFPLIHGLGHGLGVDVHDFPKGFLQDSREKLAENMVLTVEPAIYGKFGGIRIEDDVLITKRGCKQLTKAPSAPVEI